MPQSNFAVFDGWYFVQYCSQRAENCTNCPTLSALSTFAFISYIRPRLLWVKSYANEEKCKQWRQQRFAYKLDQKTGPNHWMLILLILSNGQLYLLLVKSAPYLPVNYAHLFLRWIVLCAHRTLVYVNIRTTSSLDSFKRKLKTPLFTGCILITFLYSIS